MKMELQSYKPYSRAVTIISGIIIIIASLDASQVISLFPEYASQINTILVIAGLIAPAIAQEKRVVRAEEIVKNDANPTENIHIHMDFDGTDILEDELEEEVDEGIDESDST